MHGSGSNGYTQPRYIYDELNTHPHERGRARPPVHAHTRTPTTTAHRPRSIRFYRTDATACAQNRTDNSGGFFLRCTARRRVRRFRPSGRRYRTDRAERAPYFALLAIIMRKRGGKKKNQEMTSVREYKTANSVRQTIETHAHRRAQRTHNARCCF